MRRWCLWAGLAWCSCTPPRAPSSNNEVRAVWLRCAFDHLDERSSATELEAELRRELRTRRNTIVVRWGRCGQVLSSAPNGSPLGALREAWETLLPQAQTTQLDPIALDRAVRGVGNAWTRTQ